MSQIITKSHLWFSTVGYPSYQIQYFLIRTSMSIFNETMFFLYGNCVLVFQTIKPCLENTTLNFSVSNSVKFSKSIQ
jgi:hypothetical protein